jgi:hypothetical protein
VTVILIVPIPLIIFPLFRVHFEDLWTFTKYSLFEFYEKYDASATSNLGPRPTVLYGNTLHYVTLTFYFTKDNDQHIENIYKSLLYYKIPKAVFFVEKDLMNEHPFLMYAITTTAKIRALESLMNLEGAEFGLRINHCLMHAYTHTTI